MSDDCYALPRRRLPTVAALHQAAVEGADMAVVEQHMIDHGRLNHYHRSERQRNNACEQGRARKRKRQRKAAARAAV